MKIFEGFQLFGKLKICQLMKMAVTSNPFLSGYLNFGQFDLFNPQSYFTSNRIFINRLMRVVVFINAFKLILIVFGAWFGHPELKLYLFEMYMFDESRQKIFDIGISILNINFYFAVSYWANLNEKTATLECFDFLLISELKDLDRYRQRYHLDKQSTDKFRSVYRIARLLLKLIIAVYLFFLTMTISLCLYHSFYTVSFSYFLSVGLLLWAITLTSYLFLTLYMPSKFILAFLSIEFLILRVKAIDRLICNRFIKGKLISIGKPIRLRKGKFDKLDVLQLLGDFCRQSKEISLVLDSSLSGILMGLFFTLFFMPQERSRLLLVSY